jgi:hypothetical protein
MWAQSALPAATVVAGAPLYLTGEETIKLTVMNAASGVTVKVTGRFQALGDARPRPFAQTLVPATDRTVSSVVFSVGEGWLLGVQVIVSGGAPLTGQTFAILSLTRGLTSVAEDVMTLAAGAVTARQRIAWPFGAIVNSLDGAGALRSITGTTPAAGAEISETVPTGARWELIAFMATLTCSGTVANRIPLLLLDDGTNVYARGIVNDTQTAGQVHSHGWAQGYSTMAGSSNAVTANSLPVNNRLGSGHRIRTLVTTLQAGDQWSAVQYLVREWIEGA